MSVFFHLVNILESKRMETTIPGELNEQYQPFLLQHLFSLEYLECMDRAEVQQSGLLLFMEHSSLQLYCLATVYLSSPCPKLLKWYTQIWTTGCQVCEHSYHVPLVHSSLSQKNELLFCWFSFSSRCSLAVVTEVEKVSREVFCI